MNAFKYGKSEQASHYHFGSYLGNGTSNRFSVAAIIRHFKLDRIADLQVLDISIELTKVKKQSSLSFAALNEAVRMLRKIK